MLRAIASAAAPFSRRSIDSRNIDRTLADTAGSLLKAVDPIADCPSFASLPLIAPEDRGDAITLSSLAVVPQTAAEAHGWSTTDCRMVGATEAICPETNCPCPQSNITAAAPLTPLHLQSGHRMRPA